MKITVIGLGLIGGSFCKAIKKYTKHRVCGWDKNPEILEKALECGAIDEAMTDLREGEITILCLYPEGISAFLKEHRGDFQRGSIVTDTCGIKGGIVEEAERILTPEGVRFVGGHPMAGREVSGFEASLAELYRGASFLLCRTEHTDPEAAGQVAELMTELGFGRIVETNPKEHDREIAYTSQLAHVVSAAYIKSEALEKENGFSAGSFQDMTRVARLNEEMWTMLFLENREPLLAEVDELMEHLAEFREILQEKNSRKMREYLKDSRERKEWSDQNRK